MKAELNLFQISSEIIRNKETAFPFNLLLFLLFCCGIRFNDRILGDLKKKKKKNKKRMPSIVLSSDAVFLDENDDCFRHTSSESCLSKSR